jgi:predicted nucleic acid-binding protein
VSEAVFLDSGIFIAFLNGSDRWHGQARALFGGAKPRWSTSYLVISESYSWFLHRYGEEPARTFSRLIANLPGLKVYDVDVQHHSKVGAMLERLRGSKLTYVDASSLCFMEIHKVRKVWSTDRHLGLTGAEVLPRV